MTTPDADEDDLTALYDADFPRVDLVGKGANGIPRFLIAKQDNAAGLLEPDFVRDLIAKAEPDPSGRERVAMPSGVTLSGSAADIAAFIHKAAQRATEPDEPAEPAEIAKAQADYDRIVKEKYSAADRKKMAGHEAMKDGSYPVKDAADLTHAIRAVGRGGADHDAIRRHVIARAKALGKSSEIPDNWASDGSIKEGSVSKEAAGPVAKDVGDALDAAVDDGVDGLDPTVPAAAPDGLDGIPGDPADPGSAAWEAVDAATAVKWSTILAGAKRAVCWLMSREDVEAATVDPDDAGNACDLATVCDALDYAIGELAPYAVMEQSESDRLAFEASVAKSAAADPVSVTAAVVAVAKAGRVLSSANESRIRQASQHLNDVLASLPQAPDASGQPVAKQKEAAMAADQTAPAAADGTGTVAKADADDQARDTGPVNAGGTTGLGQPRATGPDGALPADGPQASLPGDVPGRTVIKAAARLPVVATVRYIRDGVLCTGHVDPAAIAEPVAKADADASADGDDGKQLQAVFDQDGQLIGVVPPAAIQPVSGAGKPAPKDDGTAAAADGKPAEPAAGAKDAAAVADMTPAPPADAGTPADGSGDDDDVAKQATGEKDSITDVRDVLKSIVAEAVSAALEARNPAEDIAKQADVAGLGAKLEDALSRIAKVEEQPAAPKVFTNGQVPPANQLRGQDQGALPHVDVAKARVRKQELYSADAPDQARIAREMQQEAIDRLALMHAGAGRS